MSMKKTRQARKLLHKKERVARWTSPAERPYLVAKYNKITIL